MSQNKGDHQPPPKPTDRELREQLAENERQKVHASEDPSKKETLDNVRKSFPPPKKDGSS